MAGEGLMVGVGRGLMTGRGQEAEKKELQALVQDKVLLVLDNSPRLQRKGADIRVVGTQ